MPLGASTVSSTKFDFGKDGISFTGTCTINQKLSKYYNNMQEEIKHALQITGGRLEKDSVRLTPIDTGELRSRAFTSDVFTDSNGENSIIVGYEKDDTRYIRLDENGNSSDNKYAVYVHEREDLHHDVGRAKFLETASKQFAGNYAKAVHVVLSKVKV